MVYEEGFYWLYKKGVKKNVRFCFVCYHGDKRRTPLPPPDDGFYKCDICNNKYKDPNYEPAEFELLNKEDER